MFCDNTTINALPDTFVFASTPIRNRNVMGNNHAVRFHVACRLVYWRKTQWTGKAHLMRGCNNIEKSASHDIFVISIATQQKRVTWCVVSQCNGEQLAAEAHMMQSCNNPTKNASHVFCCDNTTINALPDTFVFASTPLRNRNVMGNNHAVRSWSAPNAEL